MTFFWRKLGLLVLAVCALFPDVLRAQELTSVTLAWDANSEPDLKEYRLHIGTSSRNYDFIIPVGLVTTFRVVDLPAGKHYYFALTAVDDGGLESAFSEEVTFSPLQAGGLLAVVQTTSSFQVVLNGTPESDYSIEASSNLRDWTNILTKLSDSFGVISITRSRSQQRPAEFFRAVKALP